MRLRAAAMMVGLLAVPGFAAGELDGTWAFQFRDDWAPPEVTCTLRTTGDVLAGTCSSRGRQVSITDGALEAGQARWTVSAPTGAGGALVAYVFAGSLDAQSDTINGTLTARGLDGGAETPFTARRAD